MAYVLAEVENYIKIVMESSLIDSLNKKAHEHDWHSCPSCGFRNEFGTDDKLTNYCAKCGTPLRDKNVALGVAFNPVKGVFTTVPKNQPIEYCVVEKDEYWRLKEENANISLKMHKLSRAIKEQRKKNSGKIFGGSSMNYFLSELESILRGM